MKNQEKYRLFIKETEKKKRYKIKNRHSERSEESLYCENSHLLSF